MMAKAAQQRGGMGRIRTKNKQKKKKGRRRATKSGNPVQLRAASMGGKRTGDPHIAIVELRLPQLPRGEGCWRRQEAHKEARSPLGL